ncbi:MAG: hypothetical protein ACP5P4_16105 [Steroidobacteraceae bacterium]
MPPAIRYRSRDEERLHVDVPKVLEFLASITTSNTFGNVTAIDPTTGVCTGCGFEANGNAAGRVEAFILKNQHRNLYWTVNTVRQVVDKKPSKADIEGMRYAHLDLDDPSLEALERIRSASPPPTLIIFSGGGYQGFWRLARAARITGANITQLEALNRRLIDVFGAGAGTWNIDRLMRLPATVNWLSRRKREAGRQCASTYIVEHHPERTYTTAEIGAIGIRGNLASKSLSRVPNPREKSPQGFGGITPFGSAPAPRTHLEQLYARRAAQAAASAPQSTDKSRSGNLWSLVGYYIAMGWNDEYIHTNCSKHPHVISQKDPARAIQRCIDRQRERRKEAQKQRETRSRRF